MAVEDIDLLDEALGRLVEQFKGKENLIALLTTYTTETQSLQTVLLSLLDIVKVNSAEGVQLEGIGSIVGEERFGRDDAPYRLAILARIRLNLSRGTTEDVIGLIRALAGNVVVKMQEFWPASFVAEVLDAVDPATLDLIVIGLLVSDGKAAGVGGGVHFHSDPVFRYDTVDLGFDEGGYAKIF